MFVDYAARGRAFKDGRRRHRAPSDEEGSADERRPIGPGAVGASAAGGSRSRCGRRPGAGPAGDTSAREAALARTPARQKATALNRERHQADYAILVIVVALTAIGVLMVYSSSAMKAYIASDDTFTVVGPQIGWAALGIVAMIGMMRVDYRYLRFASVPSTASRSLLLVLVFVPGLERSSSAAPRAG